MQIGRGRKFSLCTRFKCLLNNYLCLHLYSGSPTGEGLRKGIRPGEGATREVIAYVLDHGHFAGVPATAMVSLSGKEHQDKFALSPRPRHRKVGSFQQFVPHEMDCEEMGPSKFPVLVRLSVNFMNKTGALLYLRVMLVILARLIFGL